MDGRKEAGVNARLLRLLDEIQRAEEKISAMQEHLEALNIRRKQMEDEEIIKSIRSMKLGSREMLELLDSIQNGACILPDSVQADAEGCGNGIGNAPVLAAAESEDGNGRKED